MKSRGFEEVYQIEGGIAKYGSEFCRYREWEGKLYVFDERLTVAFSDDAKDIGTCTHCGDNTSNYENCSNPECNHLVLICKSCSNHTLCTACTYQQAKC